MFKKAFNEERQQINTINEDSSSVIGFKSLGSVFPLSILLSEGGNNFVYECRNCTFSQPELRSDMDGGRTETVTAV